MMDWAGSALDLYVTCAAMPCRGMCEGEVARARPACRSVSLYHSFRTRERIHSHAGRGLFLTPLGPARCIEKGGSLAPVRSLDGAERRLQSGWSNYTAMFLAGPVIAATSVRARASRQGGLQEVASTTAGGKGAGLWPPRWERDVCRPHRGPHSDQGVADHESRGGATDAARHLQFGPKESALRWSRPYKGPWPVRDVGAGSKNRPTIRRRTVLSKTAHGEICPKL